MPSSFSRRKSVASVCSNAVPPMLRFNDSHAAGPNRVERSEIHRLVDVVLAVRAGFVRKIFHTCSSGFAIPVMPMLLSDRAAMIPATCVPCPTMSSATDVPWS